VTDGHASLGHETLYQRGYRLDRFDAIVNEKTCPPRDNSSSMADLITASDELHTWV